jgi:hypothetical protein
MQRVMQENAGLFVELVIPVYQKHLTGEEAAGLIAFMRSPIGQAFIEKTPQIMIESMQIGARLGEMLGQKAGEAAVRKLRERGYTL